MQMLIAIAAFLLVRFYHEDFGYWLGQTGLSLGIDSLAMAGHWIGTAGGHGKAWELELLCFSTVIIIVSALVVVNNLAAKHGENKNSEW